MNLMMINYDDIQHFSLSGIHSIHFVCDGVHTEVVHGSDFNSRGVM